MPKMSAGILLYRRSGDDVEVLLVHPGGPFWAKKDLGAWSIPKGEYDQGDDPLETALRELEEETGHRLGDQDLLELGTIRQRSGKVLSAWAAPGDLDAETITSNTFTIEWPPRSGRQREGPRGPGRADRPAAQRAGRALRRRRRPWWMARPASSQATPATIPVRPPWSATRSRRSAAGRQRLRTRWRPPPAARSKRPASKPAHCRARPG